jgi:hypothetical protein
MKKAKVSSSKTKEFDGLISVCHNVLKINTTMDNEERQTGTCVNAQELELNQINNVDKKVQKLNSLRVSKLNQKSEELNKEYETYKAHFIDYIGIIINVFTSFFCGLKYCNA